MQNSYAKKEYPERVHQYRENIGRRQAREDDAQRKELERLVARARQPEPGGDSSGDVSIEMPDGHEQRGRDAAALLGGSPLQPVPPNQGNRRFSALHTAVMLLAATSVVLPTAEYVRRNAWGAAPSGEAPQAGITQPATDVAIPVTSFSDAAVGSITTSASTAAPTAAASFAPNPGKWELQQRAAAKRRELEQICGRDPFACDPELELEFTELEQHETASNRARRDVAKIAKPAWKYPTDSPQRSEDRWPSLAANGKDITDVVGPDSVPHRVVEVHPGIGVSIGNPADVDSKTRGGKSLEAHYGFLNDVTESLHILKHTEIGKRILETISGLHLLEPNTGNSWVRLGTVETSTLHVVIKEAPLGQLATVESLSPTDASNGKGSASFVSWHPQFVVVANRDGSKVVMLPAQTMAHELIHVIHARSGERFVTEKPSAGMTWKQRFADGKKYVFGAVYREEMVAHGGPEELRSMIHTDKHPHEISNKAVRGALRSAGDDREREEIRNIEKIRKAGRELNEYKLSKEMRVGKREFYIPFPENYNKFPMSQMAAAFKTPYLKIYSSRGLSQTKISLCALRKDKPRRQELLAQNYPEVPWKGTSYNILCSVDCAPVHVRPATSEESHSAIPLQEEILRDRADVQSIRADLENLQQRLSGIEATEKRDLAVLLQDHEISEFAQHPWGRCADAMGPVSRKIKDLGYTDIVFRAVATWHPEAAGLNGSGHRVHYVVMGTKDGVRYVVDITARQFADSGMTGFDAPLLESEDSWKKRCAKSSKRKLMRYIDTPSLSTAKETYSLLDPILPREKVPGAVDLVVPDFWARYLNEGTTGAKGSGARRSPEKITSDVPADLKKLPGAAKKLAGIAKGYSQFMGVLENVDFRRIAYDATSMAVKGGDGVLKAGRAGMLGIDAWRLKAAFSDKDATALAKIAASAGFTGSAADVVKMVGGSHPGKLLKSISKLAMPLSTLSDSTALADSILANNEQEIVSNGMALMGSLFTPIFPPAALLSIPDAWMTVEEIFWDKVPDDTEITKMWEEKLGQTIKQAYALTPDQMSEIMLRKSYESSLYSDILTTQSMVDAEHADEHQFKAIWDQTHKIDATLRDTTLPARTLRNALQQNRSKAEADFPKLVAKMLQEFHKWIDGLSIPPSKVIDFEAAFLKLTGSRLSYSEAETEYRNYLKVRFYRCAMESEKKIPDSVRKKMDDLLDPRGAASDLNGEIEVADVKVEIEELAYWDLEYPPDPETLPALQREASKLKKKKRGYEAIADYLDAHPVDP